MVWRNFEVARQLDVFRHPLPARRELFPYLIVLQHDRVRERNDLVVAPFVAPERSLDSRLYPIFAIQGVSLMLLTPAISTIQRRHLRRPVMSMAESRYRIFSVLDALFSGY